MLPSHPIATFIKFLFLNIFICWVCLGSVHAAKAIDMRNQKISSLYPRIMNPTHAYQNQQFISLKEQKRFIDANNTVHVKLTETYQGYPVWGGQIALHIKPTASHLAKGLLSRLVTNTPDANSNMNGLFYEDIQTDIGPVPRQLLNEAYIKKALANTIQLYHRQGYLPISHPTMTSSKSEPMVYIDENERAHWAIKVSFYIPAGKKGMKKTRPAHPIFIIDALTFTVYKQWDNIQTADDHQADGASTERVNSGGLGGNNKIGKLIYDGLASHLSQLNIKRDIKKSICYLENDDVTVTDSVQDKISNFPCPSPDPLHNQLYWSGDFDAINGGFSPGNDALFASEKIKAMYQDWYHIPVLSKNGEPMKLNVVVHYDDENAFWDDETETMIFGDGSADFYPFTSLGVAAHEISHGFTSQNANLIYMDQSGGLNESFSDMAAQAAEFYVYGKSSWQIGSEILKADNGSLRYMDKPSRDCGKKIATLNCCSIDTLGEYRKLLRCSPGQQVHFSSGIYNRAFYLLANSKGWNTKKAFDVMVQANRYYWLPNTNFKQAACDVMQAAKDLGYELWSIRAAFSQVGIDANGCVG